MNTKRIILAALIVAGILAGTRAVRRAGADEPGRVEGRRSGITADGIDASVRAQDDFFRHVNGAWIRRTEIPPDRPMYGSFVQLLEKSEAELRSIIEEARKSDAPAGSELRKIGDLYESFLDEERADRLGIEPLRADLAAVDAVTDRPSLLRRVAALQREGVGGFFGISVRTDDKKSDRYILNLSQGGISLPDEAYYREGKFRPIREKFLAHVEKMLSLAGVPSPAEAARGVMALETELAAHHWDRVKSRDRTLSYNKKDRRELASLAPGIDWPDWLKAAGAPDDLVTEVVVRQPDFLTAASSLIREAPLDRWKAWLKWQVIHDSAPFLSRPFVEENFAFSGRVLTGAPENRPRWKRGVALVGGALGEAVGKLYVARNFPPAAKERMKELVANLIEAYREDISKLEWMGPETRAKALDKLAKFRPKIGYPDRWRDYSSLEIRRDDLVGNVRRAAAFENARNLAKLGKPVDRDEWMMTPQTVNAYYSSGMNEIVFPAAILQPPFFSMDADDAVNYGGIGAVIGHEIGHGFDDQGSKSDGDGNMVSWWTDADREQFEGRTKKLIEQYGEFEPAQLPGQKVNGALTIGENIGDLGGLSIAHQAYRKSLKGEEAPVIDGLTGDQRFFTGWAQIWRAKFRDAELARRLATDPHSPAEFRCNGVLRNLPEFYAAFGVKEGDKLWLAPERRVKIW
ncbi:Neutral endopeptidase [Aquisphaera giovannonii]|uniref:Neutral endopeptidase n=1 Tax=Aquisphaera giovannonii TaxID=406548 RepID=A0A5B9W259_9BACT|nr:M13 family metallopeptidase [Aquisphaera giovannonii]QEH34349.1 Neutral endopeptidase [Aquisphaera giovannonii]